MAETEIDPLEQALDNTEQEIFNAARGDAPVADPARALEAMEGEAPAAPDDGAGGAGDDDRVDRDARGAPERPRDEAGRFTARQGAPPQPQAPQPPQGWRGEGRVPSARLREEADARRAAEHERDAAKAQLGEVSARLDLTLRRLDDLDQRLSGPGAPPRQHAPQPAPQAPDIFADPKGYTDYFAGQIRTVGQSLEQQLFQHRLQTSEMLARTRYGDAVFEAADNALKGLDPQRNPEHRALVGSIVGSPNPAEALVRWHRAQETLREVGDDPHAYEQRLAERLLQDPAFLQRAADAMRAQAAGNAIVQPPGNRNGQHQGTARRSPPSLNQAGGHGQAKAPDPRLYDDSERGVFEYASATG